MLLILNNIEFEKIQAEEPLNYLEVPRTLPGRSRERLRRPPRKNPREPRSVAALAAAAAGDGGGGGARSPKAEG
jgi:hypothetical protein